MKQVCNWVYSTVQIKCTSTVVKWFDDNIAEKELIFPVFDTLRHFNIYGFSIVGLKKQAILRWAIFDNVYNSLLQPHI